MYASAFDLRPQPGEMVVSRSDVKRRRKEGNAPEESIQGGPKRYKVCDGVLFFFLQFLFCFIYIVSRQYF